jgi:hypothetical protein
MSSDIELYEDERVSLDFELKARAVWLYIHERTNDIGTETEGGLLRTEALTVQDLDKMIEVCQEVRDFIKRKDGLG